LAKIRVNKLALELGLQNDQIIEALQKKGIAILNHMSSVDEEVAQDIRDLFAPKAPEKTTPKAVKLKAKTKIKIKVPSKVKITTAKTKKEIEDQVVTELKTLTDFSYSKIRKIAMRDYGIRGEIDRGRAILETPEHLSQYWFSYGKMIEQQWKIVFKNFKITSFDDGVEIIDYGCGQGGASLLFLDKFYKDFKKAISKIKLIDPGSLALQRARMNLEPYSSDIQIVGINKNFDDLETKDLETDQNLWKIHLFSNILDIDNFDIFNLFNKIIESTGKHSFIAVSPDRDFKGGSQRLENIYDRLIDPKHDHLKINWSKIKRFNCRNGSPAICFIIDLKVVE
jgi:hypothetical protein